MLPNSGYFWPCIFMFLEYDKKNSIICVKLGNEFGVGVSFVILSYNTQFCKDFPPNVGQALVCKQIRLCLQLSFITLLPNIINIYEIKFNYEILHTFYLKSKGNQSLSNIKKSVDYVEILNKMYVVQEQKSKLRMKENILVHFQGGRKNCIMGN